MIKHRHTRKAQAHAVEHTSASAKKQGLLFYTSGPNIILGFKTQKSLPQLDVVYFILLDLKAYKLKHFFAFTILFTQTFLDALLLCAVLLCDVLLRFLSLSCFNVKH